MVTKINKEIRKILEVFGNHYFIGDDVNKHKVIQDLDRYHPDLLGELIKSEAIKENFTTNINGTFVFQMNKLIEVFEADEYWQDSYTKYSKKIGLSVNRKFIDEATEVVLDFPYKDTVLKASMSREDTGENYLKPDEPFLNEVIAKEEIDVLLDKKIVVSAKKYSQDGVKELDYFTEKDNLLIKGNNLLALHTLKDRYAGQVKLIYIDPPFNTKSDSFKYNDKFSRSAWLTFMKNRLEIARELLSDDGSIYVHIDTNQSHYLKVLMDQIFGEKYFKNEIIWHYQSGGRPETFFAKKHDTIFWYTKSENYIFNKNEIGVKRGTKKRNNMKRNVDEDGRVYFSIKSNGKIYKYYEDEKITPDDVWQISHLQQQDPERTGFDTQKPEKLLERIIKASSNKGDIVLDFFAGSATTLAVAHKLQRNYIGIEQMEYIQTISVPRLQKVIEGEQSGISKEVQWQGGGSFVYVELMERNRSFFKSIKAAEDQTKLRNVFNYMLEEAEIDFKVDLDSVKTSLSELSLDDQKKILISIIDKNQLYYNYSEIDDENVRVLLSEKEYVFNKSFYEEMDE